MHFQIHIKCYLLKLLCYKTKQSNWFVFTKQNKRTQTLSSYTPSPEKLNLVYKGVTLLFLIKEKAHCFQTLGSMSQQVWVITTHFVQSYLGYKALIAD